MSTAYTLAQYRTAIRERIGYDNTTVIGDTELTKLINDAIHESWDVLCQSDVVQTDGPLTGVTVAGTREYGLLDPSLTATGIYRLKRVALRFDGYSYPLKTFELSDEVLDSSGAAWGPGYLPCYRAKYWQAPTLGVHGHATSLIFNPVPSGVYTFEYWYNPTPPVASADTDVPFSSRWPVGEYIILECSIRCMRRLRRDAAELMADRDRELQRIEQYYQPEQRERAPMMLRTKSIGLRWR